MPRVSVYRQTLSARLPPEVRPTRTTAKSLLTCGATCRCQTSVWPATFTPAEADGSTPVACGVANRIIAKQTEGAAGPPFPFQRPVRNRRMHHPGGPPPAAAVEPTSAMVGLGRGGGWKPIGYWCL